MISATKKMFMAWKMAKVKMTTCLKIKIPIVMGQILERQKQMKKIC